MSTPDEDDDVRGDKRRGRPVPKARRRTTQAEGTDDRPAADDDDVRGDKRKKRPVARPKRRGKHDHGDKR